MICADEPGPVTPRTFAPTPGWSVGGHRIKAPPTYSRGTDKSRVYGGLRIRDGIEIAHAVPLATAHLDAHAHPWIRGRPPPQPRALRRKFVYLLWGTQR